MGEARQLQQLLQRVQPCDIAALHQVTERTTAHALIVCDVALDLPKSIDMLRVALALHRRPPSTPVLFLLRDPSHVTEGQARLAGASATLPHPGPPTELITTAAGLIERERAGSVTKEQGSSAGAGAKDASKILTTLFQAGAGRRPISAKTLTEGGEVLLSVIKQARIQAWLDVVWHYDDATYQHCLLVAGLASAFALELALPPRMQLIVSQAALVHDIGKATVPRQILNKAGPLTPAETVVMRRHAMAGYEMLAGQPGLDANLLDVARHHHEYLDGSGYPDGLQAPHVSRLVRLVTICDIYAALIEHRAYRKPLTSKTALAHLDALGPKLDPALVKAFRNVVRDT